MRFSEFFLAALAAFAPAGLVAQIAPADFSTPELISLLETGGGNRQRTQENDATLVRWSVRWGLGPGAREDRHNHAPGRLPPAKKASAIYSPSSCRRWRRRRYWDIWRREGGFGSSSWLPDIEIMSCSAALRR
ncbi:hypothetical protein IMZ48_09070 [Candidatus Bathyarchaeota archaeon]|nr:hypothetical protein [Candidatus Bathyarchaeota archaeon]